MKPHTPRKRFGQNFLTNEHIIDRIITAIAPEPNDHIVEIGPGQGALTQHLVAANPQQLDCIELDRDLVAELQQRYHNATNIQIHSQNVLKFDFDTITKTKPLRIVGNLPYNISTPLLFHLLKIRHNIQDMHFMLQKEVVERICANPNTKHYGRLSVMMQAFCHAEALFEVPPTAFNPPPKVDSMIVRLTPIAGIDIDFKALETLVRMAFSQRRKTIYNNLKKHFTRAQLEAAGIEANARPETIDIATYCQLSGFTPARE